MSVGLFYSLTEEEEESKVRKQYTVVSASLPDLLQSRRAPMEEENQENLKEENDRIAPFKPTQKSMSDRVCTPTPQPALIPNYNHERVGARGHGGESHELHVFRCVPRGCVVRRLA